jgi:transcriptional regulator with XRE-family HTH domain
LSDMNTTQDDTAVGPIREALAAELRGRRTEAGLTQADLAKRLGTSQSRVAKMEGAEAGVTLDLLVRALSALGATKLEVAKAIIRPMPPRRPS